MDWLFPWKKRKCISRIMPYQSSPEIAELLNEVEKAKREWKEADQMLNYADDPEMIDYTIYALQAAERKYMYLLNRVKRLNRDNLLNSPTEVGGKL